MHKIEIFLPLPGMTAAMDAYFTRPNTFYLDGLPTGPEIHSDGLTEEELIELGYEAAKDKLDRYTIHTVGADENYAVDREHPFIDELRDETGQQIGWEFEFEVYIR